MDREGHASQTKVNRKLASNVRLKPSCPGALQNELGGSLSKLEHRAEILMAISQNQPTSGRYESAEAYKKASNKFHGIRTVNSEITDGFTLRERGVI